MQQKFTNILVITESIDFCPQQDKLNNLRYTTCTQFMDLKILEYTTHAEIRQLHKFHNFSTARTADIK